MSLSSIIPIATLTPAARIRPTLDWVAASISKLAGRSLSAEAITGTPDAAIWSATSPAFARADQHQLERREIRACSVEHVQDVAWPARHGPAAIAGPAAPAPARRRRSGSAARRRCAARRADSSSRIRWDRRTTAGWPAARAADEPASAKRRKLGRLAQGVAEQDMRRGARSAGLAGAASRPARRTGTARARVTASMSSPVSITAPCPAKMFLPATGRDDRAGHAVGAADGDGRRLGIDRRRDVDRRAERAVAGCRCRPSRRAAGRPRSGRAARSRRRCPASPICRVASITSRPAGTLTPLRRPRRSRPSRMTTVPPWIGSEPSPSATVPPVIAMVCAASGERCQQAAARRAARRFTSRLLRPAGRARSR